MQSLWIIYIIGLNSKVLIYLLRKQFSFASSPARYIFIRVGHERHKNIRAPGKARCQPFMAVTRKRNKLSEHLFSKLPPRSSPVPPLCAHIPYEHENTTTRKSSRASSFTFYKITSYIGSPQYSKQHVRLRTFTTKSKS